MFRVDDPSLIGLPENRPPVPIEDYFYVGGQTLYLKGEAMFLAAGAQMGGPESGPNVIPPVSLSFGSTVALFTPGFQEGLVVEVTSSRAAPPGCSGSTPRRVARLACKPALQSPGCRRPSKLHVCRDRPPGRQQARAIAPWRTSAGRPSAPEPDRHQLSPHPAQLLQPPGPAEGGLPRPRRSGPRRWLPSRGRRQHRLEPGADGLRGHRAHGRGPDPGKAWETRRRGHRRSRPSTRGPASARTCPGSSPMSSGAAPSSSSTTRRRAAGAAARALRAQAQPRPPALPA